MMMYASQTSTKRNLAAMREAGWRLLLSATGHLDPHGFKYALDNGAWAAFTAGAPFNEALFQAALLKVGDGADFIVIPDIVAGGMESLAFSRAWMPRLDRFRQLLLAVQDGMTPADVLPLLGPRVGIFLGGSTEWKLATMEQWGHVAANENVPFHVARVNTAKRIRLAAAAGATSCDGSSGTRFAKTVPPLNNAVRAADLFCPRRAIRNAA